MRSLLTYGLIAFSTIAGWGQVRINELMASNTRAYPDITDFEDYPDWIELHNSGTEEISLEGHTLSDNPENPLKWAFSQDAVIGAGEYLVIIADGNDTPLGTSFRRPYWPSGTVSTEKHHTNFSLSSAGEELILSKYESISRQSLIEMGSTWNFLDDGSNQRPTWRTLEFDDTAWSSGPAPLGYGDDPATTLDFGDPDERHITSYLRKKFTITDPALLDTVTLSIQVDDAALVFVNGTEVVRQNLPSGNIDYLTTASNSVTPDFEEDIHQFEFSKDLLVAGENIIAVEVHQISDTSVDMRFDLKIESSSYQNLTELDRVAYSQQVTDISLGRDPNEESSFVSFTTATPGGPNSGSLIPDLRLSSSDCAITPAPGVYQESQMVTLNTAAGAIHFTLDGREPTEKDPIFSAPITLTEPTVVRARVIESGKVPGPIITGTYLIGESYSENMPILSIVAEPETLFDDRIGIYYNQHERDTGVGPAVYKGKDAPGNIEFFSADGSEGFSVNGGLRMGGENNWASHFQRAFNFSIKGKYGDDELKYHLFPESPLSTFTALTIREGGDDYALGRMTDPFFDRVGAGRLNVETNKTRAVEVFINGAYWGHYNIRDRWDDNWFYQHYGIDDGAYDRIAFDSTSEGSGRVENGTTDAWFEFYDFVRSNDVSDPEVWSFIESRIDVDSLTDFIIAESWGNNTSWTGNREVWKAHKAGSKWRWFIPDMDRTFNSVSSRFDDMADSEQMFKYLKNNSDFVARLAQRYAAHLATTFSIQRVAGIIDEMGAEISPSITRTRDRWGNSPTSRSFQSRLTDMKDFSQFRSSSALQEVSSTLGLANSEMIIFATSGEGTFKIAGVEAPAMQLALIPGLETELEAIPAPGYEFDGWVGLDAEALTTYTPQAGDAVIAKFTPISTAPLAGTLTESLTLIANETYDISGDLIVPTGVSLTIPQGVRLRMSPGSNIRVMGQLLINGSSESPVELVSRTGDPWGGLSFENPDSLSSLTHFTVRDTTRGHDQITYPSGISGLNATLNISNLDISGHRGPLFFRGGSLELRDSVIDIPITGDGLNIKQGAAITERCTFTGNSSPDTDAIDYDGVTDGIIRDCRIYNFRGFNSDGIDTGEQCVDFLIERNTIYFNSDKGISVGQGSTGIARNNVIVSCAQGIGIKDSGSTILVDQNTFVNCAEAVAVFEKNFASGGGIATVTNCIFSGCDAPVSSDSLSTLSVSYSLSNTLALDGLGNKLTAPLFLDEVGLDFGLQANSPAINSGDPNHAADPDGSRVDMGAAYLYFPEDYPFINGDTIVVNEILANSGEAGDWIEIHNRTTNPIDISGWFLSDDGSDLEKYRLPDGTTLDGGAYLVLTEEDNFGPDTLDPARLTEFALSATGETVHLTSSQGYTFSESFGASEESITQGFYFKPSSNSYNFVAQETASQGFTNGDPAVGPIVISEIMYAPSGNSDAEYLELFNISDSPVTLFDTEKNRPWSFTDGIEFTFPTDSPVTIASGERIILVYNLAAFTAQFSPPAGTVIHQWTSGRLSNGGEAVQFGKPGLNDELGNPSYIRVDRVNYDNASPWPIAADGTGPSLARKFDSFYGNDFINWQASAPTPGEAAPNTPFDDWLTGFGITGITEDSDQDGLSNLLEYAIGSDPISPSSIQVLDFYFSDNEVTTTFPSTYLKPDLKLTLEASSDLSTWLELPYQSAGVIQQFSADRQEHRFFRLRVAFR